MTANFAIAVPATSRSAPGPHAVDWVIARRAFRQVSVGAAAWGVVFGGTVASSALTYVATFPTVASRQQLVAGTSGATGFSVLLGPTSGIDTVGGYTTYKSFVFLTSIAAIWAILTTTRLLRGEEDAGRWHLLLAGATTAHRATRATLIALGGAVAVMFLGTTVLTMAAGRAEGVGFTIGESFLYGASIALVPAVFVGVAAVASQLSRTRRTANALAMGAFGGFVLVRMVADSGPATKWLLWATPFGWTELIEPLTRNDVGPLILAALAVTALCRAATVLASHRDVGEGLVADHDTSELRPFGLRSPFGLSARLDLPVLVAWMVGVAAAGFSLGIIAELTTAAIPASMGDVLDKLGVHGSFVDQYLGVAFLLVATVICLIPAGQVSSAADEEGSGRLVLLLAGATRRWTWLGGRLLLASGGIIGAAVVAGVATWSGAASQGVDVELTSMVGAGLNVVPTALLVLGIGALAFAVAPRMAAKIVYTVVSLSLVIDLVSSMVSGLDWLGRLSVFQTLALAPATTPRPGTIVFTTSMAVASGGLAVVLFCRRDLRST